MPVAAAPLSATALRRVGTAALIANVVAIFGLGLCSVPGAYFAVRARRLATAATSDADLLAAGRALRWSWLLLGANLLLWLLLLILLGLIALSILAARG